MIRSCVICRKRATPSSLLRLQINSENNLVPAAKKKSGRTTWICIRSNCINLLEENPRRASKSLRTNISEAKNILAAAQWHMENLIKKELRWAYRSGLIQIIKAEEDQIQKKQSVMISESKELSWREASEKSDVLHFIAPRNTALFSACFEQSGIQRIAVMPNRRLPLLTRHLRVAIGLR